MATKNAIISSYPVEAAAGGTGAATLTDGGVLVGSGTGAITALSVGDTGELLVGVTGSDPAFGTSANGDFTFTSSSSGASRVLTVNNTSNTASSAARVDVSVAGSSASDPQISFDVSGTTDKFINVDNDGSDSFNIGATIATKEINATPSGEIIKTLTPAFCAVGADASNVTGEGTHYTVTYSSEYFDQGSDLNTGTGIFTAPISGRYQFDCHVTINNVGAQVFVEAVIETSNHSFRCGFLNPATMKDVNNVFTVSNTAIVDMDASDTAEMQVRVWSLGGGSTVGVDGSETFFSGFLAC